LLIEQKTKDSRCPTLLVNIFFFQNGALKLATLLLPAEGQTRKPGRASCAIYKRT
jgi:hypothetical protein